MIYSLYLFIIHSVCLIISDVFSLLIHDFIDSLILFSSFSNLPRSLIALSYSRFIHFNIHVAASILVFSDQSGFLWFILESFINFESHSR